MTLTLLFSFVWKVKNNGNMCKPRGLTADSSHRTDKFGCVYIGWDDSWRNSYSTVSVKWDKGFTKQKLCSLQKLSLAQHCQHISKCTSIRQGVRSQVILFCWLILWVSALFTKLYDKLQIKLKKIVFLDLSVLRFQQKPPPLTFSPFKRQAHCSILPTQGPF